MKLIAPFSSLLLFSSPLLATEPENLIDNPGFESGSVAWKSEKGRAEIVKGDALTGEHFIQMTDQSEEETHVYESRHYPARPGGEYTASVQVRTKDKGGQGIYLNFFNATGARLTSENVRTKGPTKSWEKITITETAPENAATVMVFLYSYLKDVGTYDFDEVSLTVKGGNDSPGLSALKPTNFEPITIESRRELFVDSHLVDGVSGLRFALHHPRDEGIALQLDQPWEGKFAAYTTILTVGDTYRAYYRGRPDVGKDGDKSESTCVAESEDGIIWTRPKLGLHQKNGSSQNNIVLSQQSPYSHNFSPFVDSNPGADPKEKFKAIGGLHPEGLALFVSPDGYRWSLKKKKILTSEEFAFDSQACAFWSELEKQYVCFFRTWKNKVRWVSRATSDDCLNWSPHVEMKSHRPAEHFYTNQTHPYFRAPHLYVSLAARFIPKRQVITDEEAKAIGVNPKYFKDASDAVFATSRGGDHFDRTFMSSFIRPGIGAQNWVSRTNYPALNVIQTSPTEMSIFLNQNYAQPTAHLRRYSLRLDGFGSIQADYDGGELLTKPLIFSGSELSLNFSTSAAGGIRIELQEPDGKVVPGFSLYECRAQIGNEIERIVTWDSEGKLQELAGKPVRLRIVMRDVDLFSMQFQE